MKIVFALLLTILISTTAVFAQPQPPTVTACEPSAEEILLLVKSTYKWTPPFNKVSIAGEIQFGMGEFPLSEVRLPEGWLTLSRMVAINGGSKREQKNYLIVIRQTTGEKPAIKLNTQLSDIKKGLVEDIKMELGDFIFVSRGCVDGKLLPPDVPAIPRGLRYVPGNDAPLPIPKSNKHA